MYFWWMEMVYLSSCSEQDSKWNYTQKSAVGRVGAVFVHGAQLTDGRSAEDRLWRARRICMVSAACNLSTCFQTASYDWLSWGCRWLAFKLHLFSLDEQSAALLTAWCTWSRLIIVKLRVVHLHFSQLWNYWLYYRELMYVFGHSDCVTVCLKCIPCEYLHCSVEWVGYHVPYMHEHAINTVITA